MKKVRGSQASISRKPVLNWVKLSRFSLSIVKNTFLYRPPPVVASEQKHHNDAVLVRQYKLWIHSTNIYLIGLEFYRTE